MQNEISAATPFRLANSVKWLTARYFPTLFATLAFTMGIGMVSGCFTLLIVLHLFNGQPEGVLSQCYLMIAVEFLVALCFQPGFIRICLKMNQFGCSWSDVFMEFRLLPAYIFATILYAIAVAVSTLWFLAPGLIVASLLSLYGFAIVEEGLGPIAALRRSVALARPQLFMIMVSQIVCVTLVVLTFIWTLKFTLVLPIFMAPLFISLSIIYIEATESELNK